MAITTRRVIEKLGAFFTPDISLRYSPNHYGYIPNKIEDREMLRRLGWKWTTVFTDTEQEGKFSIDYLQRFFANKGAEVTLEMIGGRDA